MRWSFCFFILVGCAVAAPAPSAPVQTPSSPPPAPLDVFDGYLEAPIPIADGFDLPVGDGAGGGDYVDAAGATHHGWYVATEFGEHYSLGIHPGEDWNGRGGGNTDLGQPVKTMGAGRVLHARIEAQPWGGVITIEHHFYEAGGRRRLVSQYAHLATVEVRAGDLLARGQRIGSVGRDPDATFPAHLHFELRSDVSLSPTFWPSSNGWDDAQVAAAYLPPAQFIAARRSLFVPQDEDLVVLLHQDTDAMAFARKGVVTERYEVGWGQVRGAKEERGDLKTPRGMYFVTSKARGEFPGEYGAFYGGHWIKVNYPGPQDADRGLSEGWISEAQSTRIRERWGRRELTPQDTRLGGGIGLHGWIEEWEDTSTRLRSWGCVVLHNQDITALYDQIPEGTMVVMLD
jgi:hypothetical protein